LFVYGLSSGPWDIYYVVFWFSIGLSFGISLEAVLVWNKKRNKEMVEKEDTTVPKMSPTQSRREELNELRGKKNLRKKDNQKKDDFAKTGRL